jgi:hypothetical protein
MAAADQMSASTQRTTKVGILAVPMEHLQRRKSLAVVGLVALGAVLASERVSNVLARPLIPDPAYDLISRLYRIRRGWSASAPNRCFRCAS